jgi:hypothetical protein
MFRSKSKTLSRISAISILSVIGSMVLLGAPAAHALTHSIKVAYVTDFGTGICDTAGPGFGSSVLVNAITGLAPAGCPGPGTYTTGTSSFATVSSGNAVTFTNVAVSAVDAGGIAVLAPFDTVLSYEVCDIGSSAHAGYMAALNTYLSTGLGKVIILDGDRCAPANPSCGPSFCAGTADYSTFLFPFTSNNPGPSGFTGTITFQEAEAPPAVISRNLAPGFVGPTDAVGDANTFTSNTGGWCQAMGGKNGNGVTGIQAGYARTGTGGLVIWNGYDQWFTYGPNFVDAQIFDNMLDQPFNPDSLPCGVPVTGIKLEPLTATNPVGGSHTVTATVTDTGGSPQAGIAVTFTVPSGPNAGKTGVAVTDTSGHATFTYTDTGGAGTDHIVATFTDATGGLHTSNTVDKNWRTTNGVPEFGTPATIMAAISMLALTILAKRKRSSRAAPLP